MCVQSRGLDKGFAIVAIQIKGGHYLRREVRDDRSHTVNFTLSTGNLTSPPTLNDRSSCISLFDDAPTTNTLSLFQLLRQGKGRRKAVENQARTMLYLFLYYLFLGGEETNPFIEWNPLTGSPILKYSHRYTLRFVPLSPQFTLSSDFNSIFPLYFLLVSPPLFAHQRIPLRFTREKNTLSHPLPPPLFPERDSKSNFNEANDHSRFFTHRNLLEIGSNSK